MQSPTHPIPPSPPRASVCAVCDAPLDGNARCLRVGTRIVEVCCDACAAIISDTTAVVADDAR